MRNRHNSSLGICQSEIHGDFPKDGSGSVVMTCDYATVATNDFELLVP